MITLKGFTLSTLAQAVHSTGITEKSLQDVSTQIRKLMQSAERFGEVDIRNQQQVELLAYRVKKGIVPTQAAAPTIGPRIYDLAIIGSGTTAAYYLDTLGPAHDKAGTVVIGKSNPWKEERGHGIDFINHTRRQIAMPSKNETEYGGNESYAIRREFGIEAEKVIEDLAGRHVQKFVKKIVRDTSGEAAVMRVTLADDEVIMAKRVVFAAGAGGIRKPSRECTAGAARNGSRIVDMSTFIRDIVDPKGRINTRGNVVVWGSNAAIDAVAAAKKHHWKVSAWLFSDGAGPAWLPGTRYLSPPYNLQKIQTHAYKDRNRIRVTDESDPRCPDKLRIYDGSRLVAAEVDYLVYGLGSNDLLTTGAALMDASVLAGDTALHPILDTEGVFSDPTDKAKQHQAFLGWSNCTKDFLVFGLSAENYAGVPAGGRMGRISPTDDRVVALKQWVSGDVLTVGQLTYIRSALRAVNHYIPGSIEHRLDYSHADANQVRVHLAARYPDLSEVYATQFVGMIRRVRTSLAARLPHGFTEAQVAYIEEQLAAKQGAAAQKIAAVNWQSQMAKRLTELTPKAGQEVQNALSKMLRSKR